MVKSDFRGTFGDDDRGVHDSALQCVETAIALLRLAEDIEKNQNSPRN
jgi:hypothetical protein